MKTAALSSLALLLCACGGGGGGGSESKPPVQVAPAPAPIAPAPAPALPVTLGGAVSPAPPDGLMLAFGAERLAIPAGATGYTLSSKLLEGAPYDVRVFSSPPGATTCSVQNGTGVAGRADITNIHVLCRSTQASATVFAEVDQPVGIAFDPSGSMYVTSGHSIKKIAAGGVITTIGSAYGTGELADGAPDAARFRLPVGLAADAQGNVYVADSGNNAIRKIDPAGRVSTLAGSTQAGAQDGKGAAAGFKDPRAVAVDAAGTVYVADTGNNLIRKIMPDGTVSRLAGIGGGYGFADGPGVTAGFGSVEGIATDTQGNVWVADTGNRLIRKITPAGYVVTVAGAIANDLIGTDAVGREARFVSPMALAVDRDGYVFVTGGGVLRLMGPDARVSTYGVTGTPTYTDGPRVTPFTFSRGIALDKDGNVYITEPNANLVRKITPR